MSDVAPEASFDFPDRWRPAWRVLALLEARLTFRETFGTWLGLKRGAASLVVVEPRGRGRTIVRVVMFQLFLHAVGFVTLVLPHAWHDDAAGRTGAVAGFLFLSTFMLSYAMTRIVSSFHVRRDLDLLLASPVPPRIVLAVRTAAVAGTTAATFAFFVFPFVDIGVVTGHWWMARLYPAIPLMALTITAIALSLTDLFVRTIGVRRARVGLQMFSGLVGASFYLVTQARQFLSAQDAARLREWTASLVRVDDAPWPVVAVAALADGDVLAWLAFLVIAVLLFAGGVVQAQRRFVAVAQTPDASGRVGRVSLPAMRRRIERGFAKPPFVTLLVKEWRLLLRAPQLLSQVLLQLLYLMPLLFVSLSHGQTRLAWSASALAAGIVGVCATLATSLSWLTVSGEDAPDLLAGSPRHPGLIVGAKMLAAALPPYLFVTLAAVGVGTSSVVDAMLVFVYGMLACSSAAILAAASPTPGRRSDFQRRHRGRSGNALLEMTQFLLWAAAAGTAVGGYWFVAIPVTAVALIAPLWRLPRALGTLTTGTGPA